jgi:hypothetical protein
VTPIGLVTRLIHDPLSRRRDRRASSYWTAPTCRDDRQDPPRKKTVRR